MMGEGVGGRGGLCGPHRHPPGLHSLHVVRPAACHTPQADDAGAVSIAQNMSLKRKQPAIAPSATGRKPITEDEELAAAIAASLVRICRGAEGGAAHCTAASSCWSGASVC